MDEAWKPVVGFEGLYEVSNLGRIKSLARTGYRPIKERIRIPQRTNKFGHLHVYLWKNRKKYQKSIHIVVLEAFIGPKPPNCEGRHFPDRNPANNRADNVLWGTRKENEADKLIHGTSNHGSRNGLRKAKGLAYLGSPRGKANMVRAANARWAKERSNRESIKNEP